MKNNNRHIYIFILIVIAVKILFSFFIELGNDESYYYTYALKPQLNYFDHPPMVGLLMRLSTLNLHFVNDTALRLGAILCCAIASLFIYKTTIIIGNTTAAWYAVLLYNFAVYSSIIAGFFILPDSMQMPLWCAALYLMSVIVFQQKQSNTLYWLALGFCIGLACLCKIHSLFLWAGFGLFIIIYKTKWLLNWRLYLSFIVTAICWLPIIVWNVQHNFITYRFHSSRVANTHIQWDSLLQELVGEMLYQNPIIFLLIIASLIVAMFKRKSIIQIANNQSLSFLLCLSLPLIILFWCLSLFNDILPHWSGPGYVALYIIAAIYLSQISTKKYPIILSVAGSLLLIVFIAASYIINFYPNNFGSKNKENFGEGCPTLDISGWKNFSQQFKIIAQQDVVQHNMNSNAVILINNWFPACQLQLYTSTVTHLPIVAVGNLQDVHQFAWLNKNRPQLNIAGDAYCIVPSNYPVNVVDVYGKYFTTIEKPQIVEQYRGGKVVRYFSIWRLKNCKQLLPPIETK